MAIKLEKQTPFATVEQAIEDIRQGKFVVVVDAADRENEGDLTIAAHRRLLPGVIQPDDRAGMLAELGGLVDGSVPILDHTNQD